MEAGRGKGKSQQVREPGRLDVDYLCDLRQVTAPAWGSKLSSVQRDGKEDLTHGVVLGSTLDEVLTYYLARKGMFSKSNSRLYFLRTRNEDELDEVLY